jgi:hypothetical protein
MQPQLNVDRQQRQAHRPEVRPDVNTSKVNGGRGHVLGEVLPCQGAPCASA